MSGRSLASTLDALDGFIAFIAIDTGDGSVTGLCICASAAALEDTRLVAEAWQRERSGHERCSVQPLAAGEVIVQRSF